ncbi:MAG TPA: branched-chain-amino-acid transaminase [Jatrophihabitans sp.]|nr:branched-chain-amino-acid transaminase [Jatrophihabitans sp.]
MSAAPTPQYAWLDGEVVPWDRCVLHARSQAAFWGANVFEGVRGYWCPEEQEILAFKMDQHLARLWQSMKSLHLRIEFTPSQLTEACAELVRANEFRQDVHLCVVSYFGMGPGLDPLAYTEETGVHITAVAAPTPPAGHSVEAKVSTWRRISDEAMPPRIKTGANYHNSRLAQHEAVRDGYQTALLLNSRGTVAEAPGSCLVMVRNGQLVTPPGSSGVLEGLTVDAVAGLAERVLGMHLVRREIDRSELYIADELFLCGTMAGLLPIRSVDRIEIGDGGVGQVTQQLQAAYSDLVHGRTEDRSELTGLLRVPAGLTHA